MISKTFSWGFLYISHLILMTDIITTTLFTRSWGSKGFKNRSWRRVWLSKSTMPQKSYPMTHRLVCPILTSSESSFPFLFWKSVKTLISQSLLSLVFPCLHPLSYLIRKIKKIIPLFYMLAGRIDNQVPNAIPGRADKQQLSLLCQNLREQETELCTSHWLEMVQVKRMRYITKNTVQRCFCDFGRSLDPSEPQSLHLHNQEVRLHSLIHPSIHPPTHTKHLLGLSLSKALQI